MLEFVRRLFARKTEAPGLTFSRPLVLLQSDDWGRVGVRDKEGYDWLRSRGLRLGEHPYDLYTLETVDDLAALAALLGRHHDSTGRPPCLVMNFCTANLDFKKIDFKEVRRRVFKRAELLALAKGLPGSWSRPGLIEHYREGIRKGVFDGALHGATHYCPVAVSNAHAATSELSR